MTTIDKSEKSVEKQKGGRLFMLLFLTMMSFQIQAFAAKTITLAWDPSPGINITGYKVYYGTESGNFTNVLTVESVTQATISGLVEGATYYFVVTASNSLNLESGPSEEISHTVPIPANLSVTSSWANGIPSLVITAMREAAEQWTVESSVDLKIWTSFTNGAGAIDIHVPIDGEPNRFFRLKNELPVEF